MLLAIVLLAVGFPLISKAAEQFVTGAARVSVLLGVSPIVIGAVVVGFGTSTPELLVAGLSAGQDAGDLGVGNILGADVANLTLSLGVAALISPVLIRSSIVRREVPLALGACGLFAVLAWGGVGMLDAVLLGLCLAAALALIIGWGRRGDGEEEFVGEVEEYVGGQEHRRRPEMIRLVLGIVGVVAGAQLLVSGATRGATELGLAEGFVGFTVVTLGTSLPELVTCIVAARRGESDLVVGNIVGSNLFNSLGVGAVVGFVGTGALDDPEVVHRAVVALVVACGVAYAFMRTRPGVVRWEGGVLLGVYVSAVVLLAL